MLTYQRIFSEIESKIKLVSADGLDFLGVLEV